MAFPAALSPPPKLGDRSSDSCVKAVEITSLPATLKSKEIVSDFVLSNALLLARTFCTTAVPVVFVIMILFFSNVSGVSDSVVKLICPPTPKTA